MMSSWTHIGLLLLPAFCTMAMSGTPPVRFWLDEGFFLEGELQILRDMIMGSNGSMVVSGTSNGAALSTKGYYDTIQWDVYWTTRSACFRAYPIMTTQQKVNCLPGVSAIILKKELVKTLQEAYGEAAFLIMPRSYRVPEQYWTWRSFLMASNSPEDTKWVLKADKHQGKGVRVLRQKQAIQEALSRTKEGYAHILIQQFLEPQFLVEGRRSYLRVWMVVTSITPLRAYLYKGGFAIFGKAQGSRSTSPEQQSTEDGHKHRRGRRSSDSASFSQRGPRRVQEASLGDSDIVNLWMQDRNSSFVWSLEQLGAYVDRLEGNASRWQSVWDTMKHKAALALNAALPYMRESAGKLKAPLAGPFEIFGLDFVLDGHLEPWLLEFNAIPSMGRRQRTCTEAQACGRRDDDVFDMQKEAFMHDLMTLLQLPVDGPASEEGFGTPWSGVLRSLSEDLQAKQHWGLSSGPTGGRQLQGAGVQSKIGWEPFDHDLMPPSGSDADEAAGVGVVKGLGHENERRLLSTGAEGGGRPGRDIADSSEPQQQPSARSLAKKLLVLADGGVSLSPGLHSLLCESPVDHNNDTVAPSCLNVRDLKELVELERELERLGRFEPTSDTSGAIQLNQQARSGVVPRGKMEELKGGVTRAQQHDGVVGASTGEVNASDLQKVAQMVLNSNDIPLWKKLHRSWNVLSPINGSMPSLHSLKYFHTDLVVDATVELRQIRADHISSTWIRVRSPSGCGANMTCVVHHLKQLTST